MQTVLHSTPGGERPSANPSGCYSQASIGLRFRAGPNSAAVPAGTPPGFAFREDGLYALDVAVDGRHSFVARPFEVCGWNGRSAMVLRSPAGSHVVSVAASCTLPALRRAMAQIGALPPNSQALRHLRDYLATVGQPTGSLWAVEEVAA